jgi:membrane associated rhomboid family serine protease
MVNCVNCGRELPAFGAGNRTAQCRDCQAMQDAAVIRSQTSPVPTQAARLRSQVSVTNALLGINVAVFLAMLFSGVSLVQPTTEQLLKWGANWGPLSLGPQPWRMLTSNYVHIGIVHILLNMWCLVNLGSLAERVFEPWIYFLVYTCSGLAGSLVSLWWHPMVVGAGASGAIFGLAGALIAVLYLGKLPIPKEAMSGTLKSLLAFAGYNLFFGLTAGVDNSAHIGGLLGGLVLGAALARKIIVAPEVRRQWSKLVLIAMAVVLLTATLWLRKQYPSYATGSIQYSDLDTIRNGVKALQQEHYDQAIVPMQKYVQLNPKSAEAYYLLGRAYLGANQPEAAIAAFQQALKLKPGYDDAQTSLALANVAKGAQDAAVKAVHQAAEGGKH